MANSSKNKFLYLFNNDSSRSFKMLISFLVVFMSGHFFVVFKKVINLKSMATDFMARGKTVQQFIEGYGKFSLSFVLDEISDVLILWIAVGMMIILLFSIIIWLREWYGNNKTVYTMMSIPVSRHTIIASKFCNVLLAGCIYLATQMICFFGDKIFMKMVLGSTLIKSEAVMESIFNSRLCNVLPGDFTIYTMYLLSMILIVSAIFNFVMIERAYKIKGIILCVVMIVAMGSMYIFGPSMFKLFAHEKVIYSCILSLVLIGANYYSCYYLLKNKVHV